MKLLLTVFAENRIIDIALDYGFNSNNSVFYLYSIFAVVTIKSINSCFCNKTCISYPLPDL